MKRALLAALCVVAPSRLVAAADSDLSGLTPTARVVVSLSRSCSDPTMAELFKDAFNRGSASRTLNLTAVGIDDPTEVAPDTALAKSLDAQVPTRQESVAVRYCKAQLALSNASTLPEIFRVEVQPDGRTAVVSVNIAASSFDDPTLSQLPPKAPKNTGQSASASTFHEPIVVKPAPPAPAGVSAQSTRDEVSVNSAPAPKIVVSLPPVAGKLPHLTVLCTAQNEFMQRVQDMAQPLPTHRIGPSCFFLEQDTKFTPTGAQQWIMAQVRLTDGPRAGTVAWTERRLVGG